MELVILPKKIFEIRGQRVMLDYHLAELYGVETRALKQAVKRNGDRFPFDFMFVLTETEINILVSQNVIPSKSYFGGALPYAFTEHGITMLSSVLKSKTAVSINIAIVRVFILLKQYHNNFELLQQRINELEAKFTTKIENINDVIEFLLNKPETTKENHTEERKPVGFKLPNNKD